MPKHGRIVDRLLNAPTDDEPVTDKDRAAIAVSDPDMSARRMEAAFDHARVWIGYG